MGFDGGKDFDMHVRGFFRLVGGSQESVGTSQGF